MKRRIILAVTPAVMILTAGSVRADLFHDIGFGLGYAGFNLAGQRNPLSGGVDLSVGRNFVGNPLDFGAWDLTLQGPFTAELSTGGRRLPGVDFRISTSPGSGANAQPLSYTLNYDAGGQTAAIDGTLLLDAGFSINRLGFYDLTLNYSSRQDVTRKGRFADDTLQNDTDIGPIRISGNLIADALALVTDPLFARTDATNPFASFAESVRFKLADGGLARALVGLPPVDGQPVSSADRLAAQPFARHPIHPDSDAGLGSTNVSARPGRAAAGAVVPEPAVLLLLLLGAPVVLRRRG